MKPKLLIPISLLVVLPFLSFGQLFQIGERTAIDFLSLGISFDNIITTDIRYKHITAPEDILSGGEVSNLSNIWVFEAGLCNNYRLNNFAVSPTIGFKWIPARIPYVFAGAEYAYTINTNAKNYNSLRYTYGITVLGAANIGISSNILPTKSQEGINSNRHYLFMQIPIAIISTNLFIRRNRTPTYQYREGN